jgi:dihydroneopterin aldolase/2-amino-4-hydroxy-6-hydroxymethyldihydropteridine diphosphokinase
MRVFVSLGSNLGESSAVLARALQDIKKIPNTQLISTSSMYVTQPISDVPQDDFMNAVVLVDTDLSPFDLLNQLQKIENAFGRTREVHWGPRTLDLDIITCENFESNSEALTVPHPRAHERLFVLVPMVEIDASTKIGDVEVAELCKNLGGQQAISRQSHEDMAAVGWEVIS